MTGQALIRNVFWCRLLEIEHGLAWIIRVIPTWTVTCLATLQRMPAARVIHGFPVRCLLKAGGDVAVTRLAGLSASRCGGIRRRFDLLCLI